MADSLVSISVSVRILSMYRLCSWMFVILAGLCFGTVYGVGSQRGQCDATPVWLSVGSIVWRWRWRYWWYK